MKLSTIAMTAAASVSVAGAAAQAVRQHLDEAPLRQALPDDHKVILENLALTGGLCFGEKRELTKRIDDGLSLSFEAHAEGPDFKMAYERNWDRPVPLSFVTGQEGRFTGTLKTSFLVSKNPADCTPAHYSFANEQYIPETAFPEAGK